MNNKIYLVSLTRLKCHEEIIEKHVRVLENKIKKAGLFKKPIMVSKKTLVILDGHHRFHAIRRLGFKKIPVQFIDYNNGGTRVYLRRKDLMDKLIRASVINQANKGILFPPKSTRHLIKNRVGIINFKLRQLL